VTSSNITTTVVSAVASAVEAEGIRYAFCVPDEVTIHIVQALAESGVTIVRPRHEQNAVAMADAYWRASGELCVASVGPGPALAQTGTALVTAARRRSPVVVVLGDVPSARGNIKEFDLRRFAESVGATYVALNDPSAIEGEVRNVFRLARLARGPIVFNVGDEGFLHENVTDDWNYTATPVAQRSAHVGRPEPRSIERAAELLSAARRPVIIAGRGALDANAHDATVALADRIGALLATSVQARNYFRGHPRHIGIFGGFATTSNNELIAQADCILAIGVAMNTYQTHGRSPARGAQIIQVDRDPGRIGEFVPVDLAIVGDAREVAIALGDAVGDADGTRSEWSADGATIRAATERPTPGDAIDGGRLPITRVLYELDQILPENRVVIADGGMFIPFLIDGISVPDPRAFVWSLDFGSIGLGLPMAMGAAVARPDAHCVLFAGDGGFSMSAQELETAVRERIPLTIVVLNDGAYAPEARFLQARHKPPDLAVFRDVDFAAVARGWGAEGVTLRSLDDLGGIQDRIRARQGTLLIDAKLHEDEAHRALQPGVFFPLDGH
jgi:acetolactate synthase-1/2/3 large subunit